MEVGFSYFHDPIKKDSQLKRNNDLHITTCYKRCLFRVEPSNSLGQLLLLFATKIHMMSSHNAYLFFYFFCVMKLFS